MFNDDTITSISTPYGIGAIGIIRLSGNNAFNIIGKIFIGKKNFEHIKSHTINYGKIIDPNTKDTIDEVLVTKMMQPNSFTREDIIEINCHGGTIVLKRILELVVKEGARLATPGEFTKRAFLNGRIDLSQAEAVIDVINSKTIESEHAAINQLEGKLSKRIKEVRTQLIELIAHIEVMVDYPEYDIEELTNKMVFEKLKNANSKLIKIIEGFEMGKIIREGLNVVIIGKPNVGKSSLLNELIGKTKAIVTDIPGTTRDIVEEYININGVPIKITDTAGIRETNDVIEAIGIRMAHDAIDSADLLLIIIDSTMGIDNQDAIILNKAKNKKTIILLNKIDLVKEAELKELENILVNNKSIRISAKEDIGIDTLKNTIINLFSNNKVNLNSEILVTNLRHKTLIDKSIHSINEACASYEIGMPIDLITIDIKSATEFLGHITGESITEDVMKEIFSKFCLGK